MSKVSIDSQIGALETFLRLNVRIDAGARGELHVDHMKAALETLRFVKTHQDAFRAYMAARKTGQA